ncbi:MAG: isoleucine--tRNA ligase [Candidatus Omnitrophica bacterium]|nr:isoleucine--tRNA ligase [Candidatus Omnitrophota bacterium]
MENEFDYKQTVNLPQTEFSMKANLPNKEPLLIEKWNKLDIYNKIIEQNKNKPRYILHDGPPYANGNIHIGHALNKILKDIILKYKTLSGFSTPYIPGWDCHGLPIEHQLFKNLGKSKDEVGQIEFREKAHDFAMKYVDIQKDEFKRLGVFADWDNPYITLLPEYEAGIIRSFGKLVGKGYIYKGNKPINWCCGCETALAEAEVEYDNHVSPSVYVKFPIKQIKNIPNNENFNNDKVFILIWTTTPWTLMGNVACAVHPDFTYVQLKVNNQILIMEKQLSSFVMEKAGIADYTIIGQCRGVELENIEYEHPFGLRTGRVVLADYVSAEDGSGVVHTAPGYGAEDFLTGKRYDLDVLMQVDDRGHFFANIPEVGGMFTLKASKYITEKLKERGLLLFGGTIEHSYPHCWRCKKPIIYRATDQWFMRIDHKDLRDNILKEIKNVSWVPHFGENRITSMVENRPDWCLSRQRLWGVPIPVFYCQKCNTPVLDEKVIENFAKIVEKEGTNAWFKKEAAELLPQGYVCADCGHKKFNKEKDILDVWFDSGVSHQSVLRQRKNLAYPADLYLEGSDQHRGWFQAAFITGMAIETKAPFKQVLTHGFIVDGEGKKMSKSRGNVIAPQKVIDKLGADVLRLCIASSDYNDDVRMSQESIDRVSESYRKIRNTLKFTLGNLFDYDPDKDAVAYDQLWEIDRWALSVLHYLLKQVTVAYDNFIFHQAVKLIYNFCVVEMSSFYLDVLKDRLYTSGAKSIERRSAQTVLFEILTVLTKIISPILSFTAEETNDFIPQKKQESIFLSNWPQVNKDYIDGGLNSTWRLLFNIRNCVLKALEQARGEKLIGNSLQAQVTICATNSEGIIAQTINKYKDELAAIFIVSDVQINLSVDSLDAEVYNIEFVKNNTVVENGKFNIKITKASGDKCIRCWNYSQSVGQNKQHAQICQRCIAAITI